MSNVSKVALIILLSATLDTCFNVSAEVALHSISATFDTFDTFDVSNVSNVSKVALSQRRRKCTGFRLQPVNNPKDSV